MRLLQLTIFLFVSILTGGCATSMLHDSIARSVRPYQEFTNSEARSVTGWALEENSVGGVYHWKGLLKGDQRILELHITNAAPSESILTEVHNAEQKPEKVLLLLEYMGRNPDPKKYFATYYPELDPNELTGKAFYLPLVFIDETSFTVLLLKRNEDSGVLSWDEYSGESFLEWEERSKLSYFGKNLFYIVSVPFDIVTFPIQAVVIWRLAY